MIRKSLSITLAISCYTTAYAQIDPFFNPVEKLKSELISKETQTISKPTSDKTQPSVVETDIFKPLIPLPLKDLKIEGVIEKNSKKILVVSDQKTGQIFFLKEGDAISNNEKITKITHSKVTIVKYIKLNKKIKEVERYTLNISPITEEVSE